MTDARRVTCPWCGERFETFPEQAEGGVAYTEDCPVCCRPIVMHLDADGRFWIERE
jgi:hypothetical protein